MDLFKYFFSFLAVLAVVMSTPCVANSRESSEKAKDWIQHQPVKFLENRGQMTDMNGSLVPFVLFKIETPGLDIYVTEKGLTYLFFEIEEEEHESINEEEHEEVKEIKWERIDVVLQGASIKKENIIRESPSITNYNYFYPHCTEGIYEVKQYGKITIKNVYPGIDWVFYNSTLKGFKYDFIVHSNGDYKQIKLIYSSKNQLQISGTGTLEAMTGYGNLSEHAPETFLGGQFIPSRFKHEQTIRNEQGGYDVIIGFEIDVANSKLETRNSKLIIDPQLTWGTFYGGNTQDGPMSITTDQSGNIFAAGYLIASPNFPVQDAGGGAFFQDTSAGNYDAFIIKFDNNGKRIWATYYGGSLYDQANSIKADSDGNILLTGNTSSIDFPLHDAGAFFQNTFGGGSNSDAFILKFNNAGVRIWATYYGGDATDVGTSVSIDQSDNIYVTGYTFSNNLQTRPWGNAYTNNALAGGGDIFILRFSSTMTLEWATYYGGGGDDFGYAITNDRSNNLMITGSTTSSDFPTENAFSETKNALEDVFILKFDITGTRLWATYYGGNGKDYGYSLVTDGNRNILVSGSTSSTNFPVQDAGDGSFFQSTYGGGFSDAFIIKLDEMGNQTWASYYGGSGNEYYAAPTYDNLVVDLCGNIYMSFETSSSDIQTLSPCDILSEGYYDDTFNGGSTFPKDIFLAQFSSSGLLIWATYIGGNGDDFRVPLEVDPFGNLFISGEWSEFNVTIDETTYPLIDPGGESYFDNLFNGGYDDAFILKFNKTLAAEFSIIDGKCFCDGSAMVNITSGCPPYNYLWSNANQILNSANTSDTINEICPGTYWLIITDSSCMYNADTIFFNIKGNDTPLITDQSSFICEGNFFTLPGNDIVAEAGLYTDTLTAINGCDSIVVTNLTVNGKEMFMPNSFSPNGDGVNDELFPPSNYCITEMIFKVFDRMGNRIFETTDLFDGWNGLDQKGKINNGLYVYFFNAVMNDGSPLSMKGNITLFK